MIDNIRPRRPYRNVAARIKQTGTSLNPAHEPAFEPSQPAGQAEGEDEQLATDDLAAKHEPPKKRRLGWKRWRNLSPKKRIIILLGIGIVLIGGAFAGLKFFVKGPAPAQAPVIVEKEPEPPKPTTVASRMTGVQISPELNNLPSTGVMIENSPDARPQSGLLQADVVFEAIAEGGITRFLALYQESQADFIGPVRSVRPYYLDFLVPFDAPIAHAGGSGQALAEIRNQGIKDLDQFKNAGAYHRVSSRFSPHNLYTSRAKLLELQNQKGFSTSTYTGFLRKKEGDPKAAGSPASAVSLQISSARYNVRFVYDATTGTYLRELGGQAHTDEKSGKQIAPKVVIALVMTRTQNGIYSVYQTSGSGKAYIFQEGIVMEGSWEKAGRTGQLAFKDAAGAPYKLSAGQTWLTLVGTAGAVSVTP